MDGESTSGVLSRETEDCLNDGEVEEENVLIQIPDTLIGDLDAEGYVDMLFERENNSEFREKDRSLALDNWVKSARLEAVGWILKTRASLNFRLQTPYLAITYFDRFLSRRPIHSQQSWAIRLLSMACLSLAVKMGQKHIPSLSQFQSEGYNFERKVIQRMELLVLSTLEWKMVSITPFAFVPYFITSICKESPQRLTISNVAGFIFAVMREINVLDHRPSAIAIAATLMALDQSLTRQALESKMKSISCPGFLEFEDVFQCYVLMQKLEAEGVKTPISVNSPDLLPTILRPTDVSENSSVGSAKKEEPK